MKGHLQPSPHHPNPSQHKLAPIPPLPRNQHQRDLPRVNQDDHQRVVGAWAETNTPKTEMLTAQVPNHHAEVSPTILAETRLRSGLSA